MNSLKYCNRAIVMVLMLLLNLSLTGQPAGRSVQNFNLNWRFFRGDVPLGQKTDLDDSGWRILDLPHDWSIEGPFSSDNASCTGYLPGGIAWYRKTFTIPGYETGRKVFIYFEGIYNNSEVWINGNYLGKRPNGYISFRYDLSQYLNFGGENLIAVRVDHSLAADSRWYTGSGIYRDVKLITTEPVHIGQWGIYCTTPEVTPAKAVLSADITVVNETGHNINVKVTGTLMYRNKVVGKITRKISFSSSKEVGITRFLMFPILSSGMLTTQISIHW